MGNEEREAAVEKAQEQANNDGEFTAIIWNAAIDEFVRRVEEKNPHVTGYKDAMQAVAKEMKDGK